MPVPNDTSPNRALNHLADVKQGVRRWK